MNKRETLERKANGKVVRIATRQDNDTTLSIKLTMNGDSVKFSVPINSLRSKESRRFLFDELVPIVSEEFDKMNDYDSFTSVKVKRTEGKSEKKGGK